MENIKTGNETPFSLASEKFKKYGDLGLTVQDHEALGSTPEADLVNNPGKTLGEIWSDDKIEQFLKDLTEFTQSDAEGTLKKYQQIQKENLKATVAYLKEINRLPEAFRE